MRRRGSGITAVLAMLVLAISLVAGCAATPTAPTGTLKAAVRVATLKGPTGVGMVGVMQAQQAGTAANDYTFTVSDAPDEVAAKLASGDVDIAAVPTNLGAALYAKTSGAVQMLAVNTLGVMYIVANGQVIQSMADLKGTTIYASGQGSNPEYVLRFLLQKNGIDPDTDVHIIFKSQHDEVATLVASGTAGIALLPEPFVTAVTVKNPGVTVALDLTKEWAKVVTDGSLADDGRRDRPQGVRGEEPGRCHLVPRRVQGFDRQGRHRRRRDGGPLPAVRHHSQRRRGEAGDAAARTHLRRRSGDAFPA